MNNNSLFNRHLKKTITVFLSLMLVITTLAWSTPQALAADNANSEVSQPADAPQPDEPRPFGDEQPPETPQASVMQTAAEPNVVTTAGGVQYASDEVIVKFKSTAADSAIMGTLSTLESEIEQAADEVIVADVPEGQTVEGFIETLESQPDVEYAQPNYMYHADRTVTDPYASLQWHLSKIGMPSAWDITMGLPDIRVAVLDTGIDLSHPEFSGQIYAQADTVDNDGNANDTVDGHGTHVSGIIAGKADNGIGIAGIAPGVQLIEVDVFDGDGAWTIDIIEGIQFAVANGADVINMSLGGYGSDTALETAINNAVSAGVVCVAAAGNDNTDAYSHPSDYESVISVIATDSADNKASFSNFGSAKDISAPGVDILSAYPTAIFSSGYAYADGTSMASPVVAGVVALMLSANPSLTISELKNILYNTAVDLGSPGKDIYFGNGRIDAYAAVREATQEYDVSVSSALIGGTGSSFGTASGGGTFTSCSTVTLNAVAADNYRFVRWTENGTQVSTNPTYTFTVKRDIVLTAEFARDDLCTISVATNNPSYGSVSGGGTYYLGDSVTLTATPVGTSFLMGWVEDGVTVSTDLSYTFTATKSTNIEAVFIPGLCTVTAVPNNPSYGSVTGGGQYFVSQQAVFEATPFPGHRFVCWKENGVIVSRYYKHSIGVTRDTTLVAEFVRLTPITINYTKTDATVYGGSNGTITVSPSGGDSGRYMFAINGAGWYTSNVFSGLKAGVYTITVCDYNDDNNVASCTVTIGQPASMGTVPAKSMPTKPSAGNAVTIVPPSAPRGYTTISVTYSSSNPNVASVDAGGNVTFLAGGRATIITKVVSQTVDKRGRVKTKTTTVKKTVTVKQPVSSVSLNLSDTTIARRQKVKLIPAIAPVTASSKKVKWTSSNSKVASVSSSGVVTGKAGGTAVITCTAKDGSGASASCIVTVTPIYPQSIKTSKTTLQLKPGKTASLRATVSPRTTDFKQVIWTSTNPAVVSVDSKGRIKALSEGTAVITAATETGLTSACTVTVSYTYPTGVTLSKKALTMNTGKTAALRASVLPRKTDFKTVTWASSDPAIATVDAKGKVRGISPGTVTITATTISGQTAVCTVTVK